MSDSTRELDRMIRERTLENVNKEKWINNEIMNNNKNIVDEDLLSNPAVANGRKFFIKEILIDNDDKYANSKQRNAIIKKFENKELGKSDILELVKELTDFYIGKGYSTTLLTIKEGNLRTQKITLKVLWGKINKALVEDKDPTLSQKMRIYDAFPFHKNEVLNVSDIDQALDNLLRISYGTKIKIIPDDEEGYSNLNFSGMEYDILNLGLKLNNSGRKESGWNQYSGTMGLNNFIGFNDILSFYYGYNDLKQKSDSQKSWSLSYSIPVGYWSFDTSYYRSEYKKIIGGNFGGYNSDGNSERYSNRINRVLFRNNNHKLSAYTSIDVKNNLNRIHELVIDVSSKRYSNITFGINDVTTIWDGGTYWDLSLTKGTPWFGSAWVNDPDLLGFDIDFHKINGLLSWSKKIHQFDIFSVNYDLTASFQYSKDVLVSDQNISIGDEYSVRGFKEDSISGNKGGYISNTVKFPVYINKFSGVSIVPFVGYDVGYVKNNCSKYVNSCEGEFISGGSVGLKLNQKYLSSSLSAGWPITKPKSLRNRDVDNVAIYYRVGLNF
ncbi:ShlB/FhaC/HecB family hemolysin secretion/activation protein [Citrobacter sp. JGM124]|uniref:ShlB/FhaC/HecB family hemolysin secretion/activation protein n=1 Tax=Citrobacter sp. JGM124 TaxID=2799789 RepID=UPI001BAD5ED8|nr:ShlB/FhaC/HecB family hemolysin secretion/activation protein [Citrobacter sp. JGM124]MBS0848531.1 ShlB/FhaC/HecB family hemolysin secretion/activation protein [Citrobacter sp. JGM124]